MATDRARRYRAPSAIALIASLVALGASAFPSEARNNEPVDAGKCAKLDVADGKWHRAMFTIDGNSGSIYCDGILLEKKTGISTQVNTPTEVLIGADFDRWRDRVQGCFVGTIDEIRISDAARAWSDAPLEVDGHTMALWHFDEAAGDTAYDSSGHRLNGFVYRCARTDNGFRGRAIEFTGKGYVVVKDSDYLTRQSICIELSFRTTRARKVGYASPVLIAKYVNNFGRLSEYCAYVSGRNGRGLAWTGYGEISCVCPPWR